jgi:hypothetical protein
LGAVGLFKRESELERLARSLDNVGAIPDRMGQQQPTPHLALPLVRGLAVRNVAEQHLEQPLDGIVAVTIP